MQRPVKELMISLTKSEVESIQSIAIDFYIDNDAYDDTDEGQSLDTFRAVSHAMPALKEILIICTLPDVHDEIAFPSGSGPLILFEKFPYELQMWIWSNRFIEHNFYQFSNCQTLPEPCMISGFDVPKAGLIFGWRPTSLPDIHILKADGP